MIVPLSSGRNQTADTLFKEFKRKGAEIPVKMAEIIEKMKLTFIKILKQAPIIWKTEKIYMAAFNPYLSIT